MRKFVFTAIAEVKAETLRDAFVEINYKETRHNVNWVLEEQSEIGLKSKEKGLNQRKNRAL